MGIAIGFDKNRDRTTQNQRAVMCRFVVVAVEQHEVALGQQG